jgi:hypothetical protein
MSKDHLFEDYEHVNVLLCPSGDAMRNFISWDLEREHGDLGLGSSASKPPLSVLGLSFRDHPGSALHIAEEIWGLAEGHIGLAKARLDAIHEAQSLEELLQLRHQLPGNIVNLYEAAVESMEAQNPRQSDLGLKAIAAAGRHFDGITVPRMQDLLKDSVAARPRSGEDILHAAKGFLIATPFRGSQKILVFNRTFRRFVEDRYSESLYKANLALPRDDLMRKILPLQEVSAPGNAGVRFEPMNLVEEPAKITPDKLKRTVTSIQAVEEAPSRTYIVRNGTRMWR